MFICFYMYRNNVSFDFAIIRLNASLVLLINKTGYILETRANCWFLFDVKKIQNVQVFSVYVKLLRDSITKWLGFSLYYYTGKLLLIKFIII